MLRLTFYSVFPAQFQGDYKESDRQTKEQRNEIARQRERSKKGKELKQ